MSDVGPGEPPLVGDALVVFDALGWLEGPQADAVMMSSAAALPVTKARRTGTPLLEERGVLVKPFIHATARLRKAYRQLSGSM